MSMPMDDARPRISVSSKRFIDQLRIRLRRVG